MNTKQSCSQNDAEYLQITRAVPGRASGNSADGEEQAACTISEDCGGALLEEEFDDVGVHAGTIDSRTKIPYLLHH